MRVQFHWQVRAPELKNPTKVCGLNSSCTNRLRKTLHFTDSTVFSGCRHVTLRSKWSHLTEPSWRCCLCKINIHLHCSWIDTSINILYYLTGLVSRTTYLTGLPPEKSSTMKLSISITLSIILGHCQSSTSYYLHPTRTKIFQKQTSTHVIPPDAMYGEVGEDNVWNSMRIDAQLEASKEPLLASFMHATILSHSSLERALAFHIANLLSSPAMISTQIQALILEVCIVWLLLRCPWQCFFYRLITLVSMIVYRSVPWVQDESEEGHPRSYGERSCSTHFSRCDTVFQGFPGLTNPPSSPLAVEFRSLNSSAVCSK